jgi:hypothetical protein
MSTARLIICEKSPRWAAALSAILPPDAPPLVETRSFAQCQEALAAASASVVLLEITAANLETAVALVARNKRSYPGACFLAALPVELAPAEALLREAGVAMVFTSTLEASAAVRLMLRHLALHPPEIQDIADFITSQMPWKAFDQPT